MLQSISVYMELTVVLLELDSAHTRPSAESGPGPHSERHQGHLHVPSRHGISPPPRALLMTYNQENEPFLNTN